jgi:hypothetical protein
MSEVPSKTEIPKPTPDKAERIKLWTAILGLLSQVLRIFTSFLI